MTRWYPQIDMLADYGSQTWNHHPEAKFLWGEEPWIEGIERAALEFGPQKKFPDGRVAENHLTPQELAQRDPAEIVWLPKRGVCVRRANPIQMPAAFGSNVAMQPTQCVFTIWVETLGEADFLIEQGDILIIERELGRERWILQDVRTVMYATQYVATADQSPKPRTRSL